MLGLRAGVVGDLRKRPPGGLAVFSGGDFLLAGRGGQIRTDDPLHPMQVPYLAGPRPDALGIIAGFWGVGKGFWGGFLGLGDCWGRSFILRQAQDE